MPSSPEPVTADVWQLHELRDGSSSARSTTPTFVTGARAAAAHAVALFEVATEAGIPESLLAPARAAARATGYADGWASGMRAAEAQAAAEARLVREVTEEAATQAAAGRERALAALDTAAAALELRAIPSADDLEQLIISSALAIAEAVVGHALRDDRTRAPAALIGVLSLAPVDEPVTVRLSPADHAILTGGPQPWKSDSGRRITLVSDPSLALGDAVAQTGATEIDARISAGLARVREVLAQ